VEYKSIIHEYKSAEQNQRFIIIDLEALFYLSDFGVFSYSHLLALPNEILAEIIFAIDQDVDRYCFGLACVRLFSLIEEH